jgi:hypothetical protein|tara:strand:- start:34 stop:255 length:222 start_codon:yes stop_codon:yes gene_type:complete
MVYTLAKTATMNKVNPEACLAWVLGRIPDHPVNRIDDLKPQVYQDLIDALRAEVDTKDPASLSPVLMFTLKRD